MKPDPMEVIKQWWAGAHMTPPFTPGKLRGGNDGMVRDAQDFVVADCHGIEARADVIAGALNYVVTRQDDQIRLLCATLILSHGYGKDPRLDIKGTAIDKILGKRNQPFQAPPPRMLTLKEADKIIWTYMNENNWDKLVEDSLHE